MITQWHIYKSKVHGQHVYHAIGVSMQTFKKILRVSTCATVMNRSLCVTVMYRVGMRLISFARRVENMGSSLSNQ